MCPPVVVEARAHACGRQGLRCAGRRWAGLLGAKASRASRIAERSASKPNVLLAHGRKREALRKPVVGRTGMSQDVRRVLDAETKATRGCVKTGLVVVQPEAEEKRARVRPAANRVGDQSADPCAAADARDDYIVLITALGGGLAGTWGEVHRSFAGERAPEVVRRMYHVAHEQREHFRRPWRARAG